MYTFIYSFSLFIYLLNLFVFTRLLFLYTKRLDPSFWAVGCADDIRFIIRDNLKDYIIFLDPLVLKCTVPLFKTYPDQPDHIQHVLALLTPSVIFLLSSGQIETCFVLPLWLQLNWISMALTELHKNKIARLPLLYSLYSLRSCYLYCPSFSFVDH